MLLEEIERIVRRNLNIIRRQIEKVYICTLSYRTHIGEIKIADKGVYHYLMTNTLTKIMVPFNNELIPVVFTTSKKQCLYGGVKPKPVDNPPLEVECNGKRRTVGFINKLWYLHLPDFITTQLLSLKSTVLAIMPGHILNFSDGEVEVYGHTGTVVTPYYVFAEEFDYHYDRAEKLAELIGVFDVYKRGLINSINERALGFFFYPYISLILYRDLQTTLYPTYINVALEEVIDALGHKAEKILREYQTDTLEKLKRLGADLRGKLILYKT